MKRDRALVATLIFTVSVVSLISSVGAPLLPSIADQLHVPLSEAQWSLTVTLLVGAVCSPIMGRLGDGPRRRETMIGGLAVVTLGGVLGALASNLGVLVAGRAMQGVGLGLVGLTMAAARDHLPRERVGPTIALLSVTTAAAIGFGYPVSGLIAQALDVSAAFWFAAIVSGLALVCVIVVMPSSRDHPPAPMDLPGAVLLGVGLSSLLLAIAEGEAWRWGSPSIIGLLVLAVVVLSAWTVQQLHASSPLVELRLMRHPAVLTGNVCAIVIGVAMYMYISGVIEYVQAPKSAGYGFHTSVVVAGLCLVPLSVTSFLASRALPWLTAHISTRSLLPLGALVTAVAGIFLAVWHTSLWQAFVMMAILGVGIGATSAAIPGLIVKAVPSSETGSVMGFYQVVRYVGFSVGSALTAAILAGHTPSGRPLPTESGYTLVLWIAPVVCVAAAAASWLVAGGDTASTPTPSADELALEEEDAELGPTGFVAVTSD
jgi:predicted MFS family arabinose efflux permease